LRWFLKGRLGASVVMHHDVGHSQTWHDTSVLQELWAAALWRTVRQTLYTHQTLPADLADGTRRGPTAQLLLGFAGHQDTSDNGCMTLRPLGAAQDKSKWGEFRHDILIASSQ
jgi:hypothetical protein